MMNNNIDELTNWQWPDLTIEHQAYNLAKFEMPNETNVSVIARRAQEIKMTIRREQNVNAESNMERDLR